MGFILLVLQVAFWILVLLGLGWAATCVWLHFVFPEPSWDWATIDPDDVRFPPEFVWGVASAAHQVEGGCDNNNWSWWEEQLDEHGEPRILGGQKSGVACDHWNRFPQDIQLMKQLGVSAYRFSVEWSRIEPVPGEFDEDAIQHYHDVLDALNEQGITPWITLLHFTWPLWFEELGAFEKSANIPLFLRFCERVFTEYRPKCKHWCTVNEPAVVSLVGYLVGMFPPGRRSLRDAAWVQRNLILAHAQAYRRLKRLPGGGTASIGIVKNIFQFDPYRRWFLPEWIVARVVDRAHNGAILDYLATGSFRWRVPWAAWITTYDPEVRGAGDFVGLNYYSHVHVKMQVSKEEPLVMAHKPHEVPTDFHYAMYPEGFHRALVRAAGLGKPLWVTENGVPDRTDRIRDTFIRRYLYALHRAVVEGVDVRGFFYWSLMDNFEWAEGYDQRFGLFHVDFDTQKRTLREGAKAFVRVVKERSDASY